MSTWSGAISSVPVVAYRASYFGAGHSAKDDRPLREVVWTTDGKTVDGAVVVTSRTARP